MAKTPTMTVRMAADWSHVIEGLETLRDAYLTLAENLTTSIEHLQSLSEQPDEPAD